MHSKKGIQRWIPKDKMTAYLFVFPAVLTLGLLVLYPFLYGIYVSFFNTNLTTRWNFVGVANYTSMLSNPDIWQSLLTTVKFTVSVVLGHFVIGFIFALLLNRKFKGRGIFRAILLLPWLFPEVVTATIFKWIVHPTNGIINAFLMNIGVLERPMSFLGSPQFAMIVVVIVCIWKGYPLIMVQLLAGLQTISKDIYEAAKIDGASSWQTFWRITLPTLKPTLVVSLILDTVWWFKHVTIIWLLTQGGPGTVTNTIAVDIYKRAFEYFDFGTSSAIAVLVFLICMVISVGYRRLLKND